MNKIFFTGIFFSLCFSLAAQSGMTIVLEENNGGLTITGARGKTKELRIPETINRGGVDMPITAIGEGAFAKKGLTLVTIPDSVTEIGGEAFAYNELTALVIGNSVETIGRGAFSHNRLNDLVIGTSVRSIGMGAFAGNELASITIPASVTSIEPYAFFFNLLRELEIPDTVAAIGEGAFSGNRIYRLVIGSSVNEIGDGAFFNNRLTQITIPGNITLGKRVFEGRLTKRGSTPPVDYVDENGEVLYTTANNFDTFFSSTGRRPGNYSFTRDGWTFEE